jgi:hypothetical protein
MNATAVIKFSIETMDRLSDPVSIKQGISVTR